VGIQATGNFGFFQLISATHALALLDADSSIMEYLAGYAPTASCPGCRRRVRLARPARTIIFLTRLIEFLCVPHRTPYFGCDSRLFAVAEVAILLLVVLGGLLNLPFNT
jgi:hypothetical protein